MDNHANYVYRLNEFASAIHKLRGAGSAEKCRNRASACGVTSEEEMLCKLNCGARDGDSINGGGILTGILTGTLKGIPTGILTHREFSSKSYDRRKRRRISLCNRS
jgi:hypothetical protein